MAHRSSAWESQTRGITSEGWTHTLSLLCSTLSAQTVNVKVVALIYSIYYIYAGKYGALWSMTWTLNLNQTENEANETNRWVQALGSSRLSYFKASQIDAIKIFYSGCALMDKPGPSFTKAIICVYACIRGGIKVSWKGMHTYMSGFLEGP